MTERQKDRKFFFQFQDSQDPFQRGDGGRVRHLPREGGGLDEAICWGLGIYLTLLN